MPRTKKVGSTSSRTSKAVVQADKQAYNVHVEDHWSKVETEVKQQINLLREECSKRKSEVAVLFQTQKLKCASVLHKTIEELETLSTNTTQFISLTDVSNLTSVLSSTSTVKKTTSSTRTTSRRNKSRGDDEGYLTAGSRASSETRESRTKKKLTTAKKTTRRSRSVSTAKKGDNVKGLTTPQNKQPAMFGYITPKVKPNTPQVILRRPQLGEMAFSTQGSPLMTDYAVTRNPNVNIPLTNGRTISIQPQRGLRVSELPDMDEDTLTQVKILYDNMSRVMQYFEK